MEFYAHSSSRPDRADWQHLADHLRQVGDTAARYAAAFGGQDMARVAGLLHDLGKYTERFQGRLSGDLHKVDHATWGAIVVLERYSARERILAMLLAYTIAGHHAGLANGHGGEQRSALQERLSADYRATLPPLLDAWRQEIELPAHLALPKGFTPRQDRGAFQLALLARMIFSCLVDADFVDTDNFYRGIEGEPARKENAGPSLQALRQRLDAYLAGLPREGGINPLRTHILTHIRGQATERPGLFSLTVPTGGGKTLASLAFALDHALVHGLRRVIYVIPFTSIVEQNAQVFRRAFGDLGEAAVLEHHSAFFDDPRSAPQAIEKRRLAMENWDAPVVVTTAVQFFESLFADRSSRCRKLHNIAGSVVILDEAQTLPLELLRPCVALLDELALNYRTSLVLCTATQPTLTRAQGFKDGLEHVHELAPDPPALYRQLRRVGVRHVGPLGDDALADYLRQRQQVLCIVNNRRHARHLFESIADAPGTLHLTTLMYAHHRSQVLHEVRRRLKAGEPCRVVSTSLIEAGVDVDFPTVLRAEAGLDSIAQAAGRCNREGRQPIETSEVLVFETANPDWAPPPELRQFAAAFREVERHHRQDLLAPEAVDAYFRQLYWLLGDDKLDKHGLLNLLKGAREDSLPLETLAARFKVIQTAMRPVIVPFDPDGGRIAEVDKALDDLAYAPAAARKLQPYLVQVPRQAYDALWQAHAIEPVAPDRYGDQFVRLVNPRLYDTRFGLHWDDPQFLAAESLVA
ncbi:CRISPR-associated endonuclease Cas3'' [Xanthomonas massiliensis]|uniref:CRISPR-associated endonuclease Cas3'' n=1 Tax=Xanthomonas massiliensis TaxID=1720302 RepID=UPI000825F33E|nr:CRISPR-associated endonuclease Cas3'' [Xanthomonas massiliensis]